MIKTDNLDLTPKEMADRIFEEVYAMMPDATDWMPDFMIVNLVKQIVVSVLTKTMDFHLWDEKKFFYWEEVISHIKNF